CEDSVEVVDGKRAPLHGQPHDTVRITPAGTELQPKTEAPGGVQKLPGTLHPLIARIELRESNQVPGSDFRHKAAANPLGIRGRITSVEKPVEIRIREARYNIQRHLMEIRQHSY